MNKLVQHINLNMLNFPKEGMYCYGEANFEANQAMQEPLEKLYKYENQPDMREKVKEYISELDTEIDRYHNMAEENEQIAENMIIIIQVLTAVKNDLQGRLDELI